MQEDLIIKMSDFGLTINQAKVYLSIVQYGAIPVCKIAKITQLHRQDIYKILPKLEKMGIVAKTIDNPFLIKANPIETAVRNLVILEKEKAKKRILRLEHLDKELMKLSKNGELLSTEKKPESEYVILTTDTQIKCKTDYSFHNARKRFDLVTNLELIMPRIPRKRELLRTLANNNVKIRLIIEGMYKEVTVKKVLDGVKPDFEDFEVMLMKKPTSIPYQILDEEELWVFKNDCTESGHPCVLWTNGKNIVKFYQNNFNSAWESKQAISIYPENDAIEAPIFKNLIST